jgi:CRISPR-associated protein Csb2
MEFGQEVVGPIVLGHSSHFGMGLFRPVNGKVLK